jgi:hypothetical protein
MRFGTRTSVRHAVSSAALGAFALLALAAPRAHAQAGLPVMNGMWKAGATAINVAVESWGKDCGPPPTSSQSSGGGVVRIDQSGENIALHGPGRVVRSNACFGQNPSLSRKASSFVNNTWTTRCETPQDDPRAEAGTYTLKLLAPDRLLYQDVSRFRWRLKTSLCVATISTVQTLTREGASGAGTQAPTAAAPSPAPTKLGKPAATIKPSAPTAANAPKQPPLPPQLTIKPSEPPPCVPGEPKRLALLPRRSRLELGGRLCLRARAFDASNCPVPNIGASFDLQHAPALRASVDDSGCFSASAQAADGEGAFTVTASARGLRAEASIEVVAADLSALIAKRLFEADAGADEEAVAVEHAPAAAAPEAPAATSHTATRAVGAAQAQAKTPAWLWPIGLGVIGVLGLAIVLALRRRAAPEPQAVPSAPPLRSGGKPISDPPRAMPTLSADSAKATVPSTVRCPKCGATYPAGSAFCGTDGSRLNP